MPLEGRLELLLELALQAILPGEVLAGGDLAGSICGGVAVGPETRRDNSACRSRPVLVTLILRGRKRLAFTIQ